MNTLSDIATNLVQNDQGLWVARNQSEVAYPAEWHEACFAVEDRSFWFEHRNHVIVRLVKAFPPDGALFDVGGGNGYVSMALQQSGIDAVVVEPGADGAWHAMQRGVPVVIRSTLEDAGFKDASVAAFGLFDVLEHIEQDRAFLQRLSACLVKGGWLYLTVPAYNVLWSVDDDVAEHFRRYTTRTLAERLTAAGFAVRYCSYFFSFLVPAVLVFRAIPSRLRLRRRAVAASAANTEREHATPSGVAGRFLQRCRAFELRRIAQKKRIPTGSSCVAVAQKIRV